MVFNPILIQGRIVMLLKLKLNVIWRNEEYHLTGIQ